MLCHVLQDGPAGAEGLEDVTHCASFQPDPLCDSVKWSNIVSHVFHVNSTWISVGTKCKQKEGTQPYF